MKLGGEKLRDSKRKTCTFDDNDGHDVTYIEARTVKIISPAVLKRLMGDAFGDYIKESLEPKYTFKSKELERTFASVYSADIAVPERKLTVDEFYDQLPCDDSAKSALRKSSRVPTFLQTVRISFRLAIFQRKMPPIMRIFFQSALNGSVL